MIIKKKEKQVKLEPLDTKIVKFERVSSDPADTR